MLFARIKNETPDKSPCVKVPDGYLSRVITILLLYRIGNHFQFGFINYLLIRIGLTDNEPDDLGEYPPERFRPERKLFDRGEYARYREYLKVNGLFFWDVKDVEKWKEDVERYPQTQYRQRLFDALGIKTHELTDKEKSMKVLKTLRRFALKSAKVGADVSMKIMDNIAEDDTYSRRRRKSRRKRSRQ